jgi:hypothetical protein
MSSKYQNLSAFLTMINRTEYEKCNEDFYKNLDNSIKENKVKILISEWNKCSSKEVIEKINSFQKTN